MTCGVDAGGKIHYDEKFPDQLRTLYAGRSGWRYAVEADAGQTRTPGIWVSHRAAAVVEQTFIPDVHAELLRQVAAGVISLTRYEEKTAEARQLDEAGIRWELTKGRTMAEKRRAFLQKHFPQCVE